MHDTDRRVIYTKKILRSSLMKLLQEKPIGRISVTELCNVAGVNRGTFYSHYRQPEDVMHQIEDELVGEIESVLEKESDMFTIHKSMLELIENNRNACRVLFGENGDPECVKRILAVSQKYFKANWQDQLHLAEDVAAYMHSFIFAGTVEVLIDWVINDEKHTAAEMATIINNLQKHMLVG